MLYRCYMLQNIQAVAPLTSLRPESPAFPARLAGLTRRRHRRPDVISVPPMMMLSPPPPPPLARSTLATFRKQNNRPRRRKQNSIKNLLRKYFLDGDVVSQWPDLSSSRWPCLTWTPSRSPACRHACPSRSLRWPRPPASPPPLTAAPREGALRPQQPSPWPPAAGTASSRGRTMRTPYTATALALVTRRPRSLSSTRRPTIWGSTDDPVLPTSSRRSLAVAPASPFCGIALVVSCLISFDLVPKLPVPSLLLYHL